ncbi:hypothetical protein JCM11641_003669 [Rhodosporidiobolus odoratus]
MTDLLPLYLSSSSSSPHLASNPSSPLQHPDSSTSRLSFPQSVHTLAPDSVVSPPTRRDSFRPPLPPKPASPFIDATSRQSLTSPAFGRSASAESPVAGRSPLVGGRGGKGETASPAMSDSALSNTSSPSDWMDAMMRRSSSAGASSSESQGSPILADGVGLGIPAGARTPRTFASARGGGEKSGSSTPTLVHNHPLPFMNRKPQPPPSPTRPFKISSPALQSTPELAEEESLASPLPSSAPSALSPFSAAASSSASASTSMPPPPLPLRRLPPSTNLQSSSASIASSSSSSSGAAGVFSAVGRGLHSAKLKDRFGAGVGLAREWGGKGGKAVVGGWRGLQSARSGAVSPSLESPHLPSSASSPALDLAASAKLPPSPSMPLSSFASSSSGLYSVVSTSSAPAIKLPCTILGVRVPNLRNQAFGVPLAPLVTQTRLPPPNVHTTSDDDEITGSLSRLWLAGIAFRCLQYLDEIGRSEEGIYRVPGRGHMVNMLRAMFDAGVGQEVDLREIHLGELDPAAVASCFKGWLRELPEPLLSPSLSPIIDALTLQHLGYSATSSSFLSSQTASASTSSNGVSKGISPAAGIGGAGTEGGRAPREYLEALREVFAQRMEAENYYLLRAIAYHLARLSAHSATNKMTLMNLKLILSPTLRLSPGFLQVLVVEREILFSKANEPGRQRQVSASSLSTPPLPSSAFPSSSPRLRTPTPRSSPLLNPPSPSSPSFTSPAFAPTLPPSTSTPTLPHSISATSAGSWLVVDGPPASPNRSPPLSLAQAPSPSASPVPSPTFSTTVSVGLPYPHQSSSQPQAQSEQLSPPSSAGLHPSQRGSPQTPIADRFSSANAAGGGGGGGGGGTPSTLSLRDAFNSSTSSSLNPSTKKDLDEKTQQPPYTKPAFLPSRDRANGAGGGGFFGSARPGASVSSPSPSLSLSGSGSGEGKKAKGEEKESRTMAMTLDGVRVEGGRLSLGDAFRSQLDFSSSSADDATEGAATLSSIRPVVARGVTGHRPSQSTSSSTSSAFSSSSASSRSHSATRHTTAFDPLTLLPSMSTGYGIGLGLAAPASSAVGAGEKEEVVEGEAEGMRRRRRSKSEGGLTGGEGGGEGWGGSSLLSMEERRRLFGG